MAQQFTRVNPGELIKAALINELEEAIENLSGAPTGGPITVPNLFGLTLGNAAAILTLPSTQLAIGSVFDTLGNSVDPTLSDSKPLLVLNQMPVPNTQVYAGSSVNLVVAPKSGSAPPTPQVPVITSFNPIKVPVLTQVDIGGQNLSGGQASFDGVAGIAAGGSTKDHLFVVVPTGIPSAPTNPGQEKAVQVIVTTPSGGPSTPKSLTILPAPANPLPTITNFNPASGTVGSDVTISGTGFNGTPANNTVNFDNVSAVPKSASPTQLIVTIPQGISGLNKQFDSRNVPITVKVGSLVSPSKDYNITLL